MQRKILIATVVTLLAATLVLGVRLYQVSERLDKAEQYMMSAMVSWVGACTAFVQELQSHDPSIVFRAANVVRGHCVSEQDWPTVEALLAKGQAREAASFTNRRLFGHHLPELLKRGSYDSSSFPVGYP